MNNNEPIREQVPTTSKEKAEAQFRVLLAMISFANNNFFFKFCKKCHNTGMNGFNRITLKMEPCGCLIKQIVKNELKTSPQEIKNVDKKAKQIESEKDGSKPDTNGCQQAS